MINKERLEELIKEGATIYYITYCNDGVKEWTEICDIDLFSKCTIIEDYTFSDGFKADVLHCCYANCFTYHPLKELFETRKQAEWTLKYHKTRIEKLELPTWEEFKDSYENMSVSFVGWDWFVYEFTIDNNEIVLYEGGEVWLRWDFNEENYIKACDLCLNLFEKGEE